MYVSKDSIAIHLTGSLPWMQQMKESYAWVWNCSTEWLRLGWPWVARWFYPIIRYKKFLGRRDNAVVRLLLDLASYKVWVLCWFSSSPRGFLPGHPVIPTPSPLLHKKPPFQIPTGPANSGKKEPPHGISTAKFKFFPLKETFCIRNRHNVEHKNMKISCTEGVRIRSENYKKLLHL